MIIIIMMMIVVGPSIFVVYPSMYCDQVKLERSNWMRRLYTTISFVYIATKRRRETNKWNRIGWPSYITFMTLTHLHIIRVPKIHIKCHFETYVVCRCYWFDRSNFFTSNLSIYLFIYLIDILSKSCQYLVDVLSIYGLEWNGMVSHRQLSTTTWR